MLEGWTNACLALGDLLLGWLLAISRDAALVVVAVGTSLLLVAVRCFTTNQNLLARAAADKKRLAQLLVEDRARRDRPAIQRRRATFSQIAMLQLRAEGWPLLASLLPIAVLATWAFARLEFLPPRAGESVQLELTGPAAAIGGVAHLTPQDGLSAGPGWVRPVEEDLDPEHNLRGVARWAISAERSDGAYPLVVRTAGPAVALEFRAGQAIYAPSEADAKDGYHARVVLPVYHPFGIIPGIDTRRTTWLEAIPLLNSLVLAPWLVGYLLLVVPLALVLRPVFRIY